MDDSTNAPINDEIQWEKQLPSAPTKQIESIIDQRVAKNTRKKRVSLILGQMEESTSQRCYLDDINRDFKI